MSSETHAYVKIENILNEIRIRVLNIPCPECGAYLNKPAFPGEEIRCEFCGSASTIEKGLNAASEDTLRRIVSDSVKEIIERYGLTVDSRLGELTNYLQEYAKKVFGEIRLFYELQRRLPTKVELDEKIDEETQKILEGIKSMLETFKSHILVQINDVTGKIDDLQVSISELSKLLEEMRKYKPVTYDGVFIAYRDGDGNLNKIKIKDAIIGRNEETHEIEIRSLDGNVRRLRIFDPTVSRSHLKVSLVNGKIILVDLESKNGTFINEKRIPPNTPHEIDGEARIRLGWGLTFELKLQ